MNGGPSGFGNAPVTRAFISVSAVFTVLLGIQGRGSKLGLSYQDVFGKLRVWKLIVSLFSFSSTPELMFGLYLLYYFRVFERQKGSNKFSVFILFSSIVSLLFEVLSLALLKVTSGPYGLIFASFVPFFFDIPVSTLFSVFGLRFSDKFFIYLAGVQLLLSSWRRSIVPGLCGVLAGSLYRLNFLCIRKAKIPEIDVAFLSRFSWLSIGSPTSASSRNDIRNAPPFTPPVHPKRRGTILVPRIRGHHLDTGINGIREGLGLASPCACSKRPQHGYQHSSRSTVPLRTATTFWI